MRRLAALFLIAALAPAAAHAQKKDVGVTVKPRPMHVVDSPRRQASALPWAVETPPPALLSQAPVGPAADPGQCGVYCAQTYYFCLSRDYDPDCGSNWSQCRASCSPSVSPDWRAGR